MKKAKLIRANNGKYHIHIEDNNQWGFSLISKSGYRAPGGFDFAPIEWTLCEGPWPKWAQEKLSDLNNEAEAFQKEQYSVTA